MNLPTDVEEILSDEYEEGEILDGDNLYDEVSSLEEFSSCDEKVKDSPVSSDKQTSSSKKCKHRRKDHQCKEDSVCRKERKPKHCYARIRKSKSILKCKTDKEPVPPPTIDKLMSKKVDVTAVTKFLKCRPLSPYRLRQDPPKITHRYDHKDHHEKENRHINKRYWANFPTTSPRSKFKPPDKYFNYNRNKTNKDNYYSKSRHQISATPSIVNSVDTSSKNTHDCENTSAKTSLLKRLVGSGSSGLKPVKENEIPPVSLNCDVVNPDSITIPVVETVEIQKATLENDTKSDSTSNPEVTKPDDSQKTDTLPEPSKKFEVKWIRSIKEDKDELHLRVEALRSAWIKKFRDRKKRGLIHQKKFDGDEDFLENFAFGSDSEDENDTTASKSDNPSAENDSVPHFNATDISGDILKPEDMVIAYDKLSEELTIISETAVTSTEGTTPVFVDPLFLSSAHLPSETLSLSDNSLKLPVKENIVAAEPILSNEKKLNENYSQKLNKSRSKRSKPHERSKRRKSKSSYAEKTKNVANISADLDEDALRELALLSVKSKNRNRSSVDIESKSKIADQFPTLSSNIAAREVTALLSKKESIGAANSDDWEDDLDEDILRAKLLSSLTKQVSEESAKVERATSIAMDYLQKDILINPKILKPTINIIKPPISKKLIAKKVDRRKIKNINKKVWKQTNVSLPKSESILNTNNRFNTPNVFKKLEKVIHPQENNNQFNVRPIPQVAQMIITLDDSDSSSDIDTSNSDVPDSFPKIDFVDIEANIDNFLREAELNSQLEKGVIDTSSSATKEELTKLTENGKWNQIENQLPASEFMVTETRKTTVKTPSSTSSSSSSTSVPTPQAVKHLPPWQQEEYKRLKKKLAEKEEVLRVTRSKIIDNAKDNNINIPPPSEPMKTETNLLINNNHSIFPVKAIASLNEKPSTDSKVNSVDNAAIGQLSVIPKVVSASKDEVSKVPKIVKNHTTEESSAAKKSFNNLVSCSIMEEINVMNDVLNDFDKNTTAYLDLKQKLARLKRIVKVTESKIAAKEKRMLIIKDTITEKERQISSKITTFCMSSSSPNEKNKQPTREMELVKLKHKEVSLRAQFLFHDFLNEKAQGKESNNKTSDNNRIVGSKSEEILPVGIKRLPCPTQPTTPLKKKLKTTDLVASKSSDKTKENVEAPLKRNFSGKERERDEWDPNTPVCHYDLNGICRDDQCQYQHFKTV